MSQPFAIVFTDLVDSTRLKSLIPGDSLAVRNRIYSNDILTPHRQRTTALIAAHAGTEIKTIGDSYFIRFPEVINAALFAAQLQSSHTTQPIATPLGPLQLRIGIHYGAPEDDPLKAGDYVGQEVDYAARLMSLGNAGQIVLSELAASLLKQALADENKPHAHGDRELKGIGRVPVFELLYDNKPPRELSQAALAPHNLPPRPIRLAGRDELLSDLRERIHHGGSVVLKAEGGMGKTTLALAATHGAIDACELSGGVAWISCELKPKLCDFLRQASLVFFGDRIEEESVEMCSQRVRQHLKTSSALVVLDNLETVARDPDFLRWIAEIRAPQRVLVTTREVPSSLHAQVITVSELARPVSMRLFRELCEYSGRKLQKSDDALIDQICASVGDHPLAIELLATRAARVPLAALAKRVTENLHQTAAVNDPLRPQRQQSLRASFDLSFEPLSADARQLLVWTSVLPGGVSPNLLGSLPATGDLFLAAEELVDSSLWRVVNDRYVVHPLVRQAALERLPADEAPAIRLEVARAVVALAREYNAEIQASLGDGPRLRAALDQLELELPNFISVGEIVQKGQAAELADDLFDALEYFWRVRGHWLTALQLAQGTLDMPRETLNPVRRAKLLQGVGRARRHLMQFDEAVAAYREAVGLFEAAGVTGELGEALGELSRVYSWMDRLDESLPIAERAVAILRDCGGGQRLALALVRLGVIYGLKGDGAAAFRVHSESLAICRAIHDRRGEGRSLGYLGDCYRHQEKFAEADKAQAQSLEIARELNDRRAVADTLLRIGKSQVSQQKYAEAETHLLESLAIYREIGSQVMQARILYFYAWALQLSDRIPLALATITESSELLRGQPQSWFAPRVEKMRVDLQAAQAQLDAGGTPGPSPVTEAS